MKQRVLILCVGNSCRSQMAEGFLRHWAGTRYEVHSAGTRPSVLNSKAIQVMGEIGIDISQHRSKSVNDFEGQAFDHIVTVCDAAKESCPVFPHIKRILHWNFEDPADAQGSEDSILQVFRRVRDEITTQFKAHF